MKDNSEYVSGEYIAKHPDWHQTDSPWKASQISKIIDCNNVRAKKCSGYRLWCWTRNP